MKNETVLTTKESKWLDGLDNARKFSAEQIAKYDNNHWTVSTKFIVAGDPIPFSFTFPRSFGKKNIERRLSEEWVKLEDEITALKKTVFFYVGLKTGEVIRDDGNSRAHAYARRLLGEVLHNYIAIYKEQCEEAAGEKNRDEFAGAMSGLFPLWTPQKLMEIIREKVTKPPLPTPQKPVPRKPQPMRTIQAEPLSLSMDNLERQIDTFEASSRVEINALGNRVRDHIKSENDMYGEIPGKLENQAQQQASVDGLTGAVENIKEALNDLWARYWEKNRYKSQTTEIAYTKSIDMLAKAVEEAGERYRTVREVTELRATLPSGGDEAADDMLETQFKKLSNLAGIARNPKEMDTYMALSSLQPVRYMP